MGFKSDKQRKGFFANKGNQRRGATRIPPPIRSVKSQQLSKDLKRDAPKEFKKLKDTDKDGTPDLFDSKPLDPKKQSFLHDFQLRRLRRQEEKLETIREREVNKLEKQREVLQERQKVASKKAEIKQIQAQKKQAVIDEINREKKKIEDIRQANLKAKQQLDKITVTGRTKTFLKRAGQNIGEGSKSALQSANAYFHKESTKRTLEKIGKAISGTSSAPRRRKTRRVRTSTTIRKSVTKKRRIKRRKSSTSESMFG